MGPTSDAGKVGLIPETVDNFLLYGRPRWFRATMDRDRMKYLLREILGVDVDQVVQQVVATISVERAKQAQDNTRDWKRYMEAEGGIVILPSNVTQLGRKAPKG